MLFGQMKRVYNLEQLEEGGGFGGSLTKLSILMLLHDVGKDSQNSCGGVPFLMMKKGHFIYRKMRRKGKKKLVLRI
jgi:hypothetical protein